MASAPEVTVEVAFASDPSDAEQTWEDITEYCREVSIQRGRSRELDRFQAGTLTVTLANEDRRFDPTYESSPYAGGILPMRQVRVRATWKEVTYDLFHGYVDGWQQVYQHPEEALAVMTATDGFKVLDNIDLPESVYMTEVLSDGPIAWWRFSEGEGETEVLDEVRGFTLEAAGSPTTGADGLVIGDDSNAVHIPAGANGYIKLLTPIEGGPESAPLSGGPLSVEFIYKAETPGSLAWDVGQTDDSINPTGWELTIWGDGEILFGVANAGTIYTCTSGELATVVDGNPHHIAGVWDENGDLKVYLDGQDVTLEGDNIANFTFPPGGILAFGGGATPVYSGVTITVGSCWVDEFAVYDYALPPERIEAHYLARRVGGQWAGDLAADRLGRILDWAEWPDEKRDLDDGVVTLQRMLKLGGTVLDHAQKVEATEQGLLFMAADGKVRFIDRDGRLTPPYTTVQATFGEDSGDLEFTDLSYQYDDLLIFNEVVVQRDGGTPQRAVDADSKAKYLRRVRSLTGLLHSTDAVSQDLARYILSRYSEPFLRVTGMTIEPVEGNGETLYPQVLGRELGDRIRVKRRPQDIGPDIDQEAHIEGIQHTITPGRWVTQWHLSPADTREFWIVGTSELDTGTRLAF